MALVPVSGFTDLLRTLSNRAVSLFRGSSLDRELDAELATHIALATEEKMRSGVPKEKARRAALCEFGGVTQIRESYRNQRGLLLLETFGQDLRFAFRMWRENPGFAAIVIVTLALGIGANTAIFSIVDGVLLNPLPFPQPDRLVAIHESKPNFDRGSLSYQNFLDWQKDNRSFSAMAVARAYAFSLTGKGDAEQVNAEFVTSAFFPLLGVQPLFGRTFTPAEDQRGAAPVVLISEGLWRRKFDAAPSILGQSVTLDGKDFTIVGVIPAAFHLRLPSFHEQDIYAPVPQWSNPLLWNRSAGLGFHGIARLKPGVTLEQARTDMSQVTRNLAAAFPGSDQGIGASIVPLKEQIVGNVRSFLLVLLGAVGFVLLIACVNVAGLLLARSAARSREFAVRIALGASRGRVLRQLLTESLLLGVAGGVISLVPAVWGTRAVVNLLPAALPRAEEIGLDFHVLAFTTTVSLLTGTLFGLIPALRTCKADPQSALKQGGRGAGSTHHRALATLIAAEMAIALVLLAAAGLMIRSLVQLWDVNPGFNPRQVLNFGMSLSPSFATASPDTIRTALRQVEDAFASVPGVNAVSMTWGALPMGDDDEELFWLDTQPRPVNDNGMSWTINYVVEPDYLKVIGIALRRGRFFTRQDNNHTPPVVVVDDVFARKFFPNQDPIGQRIHFKSLGTTPQIVGVVDHVKQWGLDLDDANHLRAQIYVPCMQMSDEYIVTTSGSSFLIRYEGNARPVFAAMRRANRRMSAEQVIYADQTMESLIAESMSTRRLAMILLGAFAVFALVLACIGIYGVMSYLVSKRTQEVGIRMALGARRIDALALVLGDGAKLALIGVAIGLASALVLTRLMGGLLFGVKPYDPTILLGVSVLLIAVALIACMVPARRAASVDPMQALRAE